MAQSAGIIVPLVLQLLPVRSVVDIGCGDGSWLGVFRKHGVADILGADGDYVDRDLLQIPPECFRAADLTKRFGFGATFDLAISLEVAEHLPAECAALFVECLTNLAPVILFSAAIPFQGGDHHVNEQWPDKWAELFEKHGYVAVDCIRKRVWGNEAVEWWYAQNTLLFARTSVVESNAALKAELEQTNPNQLCLVHPRQYLHSEHLHRQAVGRLEESAVAPGTKAAAQHFLACLRDAVRRRFYASPKEAGPPDAEGDTSDSPARD